MVFMTFKTSDGRICIEIDDIGEIYHPCLRRTLYKVLCRFEKTYYIKVVHSGGEDRERGPDPEVEWYWDMTTNFPDDYTLFVDKWQLPFVLDKLNRLKAYLDNKYKLLEQKRKLDWDRVCATLETA